ncbi:MAG: hypothetical protein AAGA44_15545 [Pseudomonadota bacterium]
MRIHALPSLILLGLTVLIAGCTEPAVPASPTISVSFAESLSNEAIDGRLLLMMSKDGESEPRLQVRAGINAIQIFGVDVEGMRAGQSAAFDADVFGYPADSLSDLPDGEYVVQALLHRYETFNLGNGKTVSLPMDRGEGQQWRRAPGNLYSTPINVTIADGDAVADIVLDQMIPEIEPPADTGYIKHVRIRSERLSEFWGRDMYLGAHVLLPEGFDEHPDARYPLAVFHGHFPSDFGGFRATPPDADLECEYSERFNLDCYNRIQQEEAYGFYQTWTGPDFPRMLIIQIQHANPYYDDSYAVNSANLGPYGDAITYELIPFIEETFRGLGEPWARFLYGGSTGGWEAMAAQVFYPDDYNGAFAACPDPIDFRAFVSVNLYEDDNLYFDIGPMNTLARPERRDYLGHISVTMEDENHMELVLGTNSRSGGQYDIWEAVYSPMDDDGYPRRAWNKRTGEINRDVIEHWRDNYDLVHILKRDWETLGPKLEGKLHIYAGDMDNYYLNNAVYLAEDFLEGTENPYYAGVIDYGDRAEHCWNGDHDNPNAISRLRYNTLYVPRILERIESAAPEGADLTSWRY